MSYPYPHQSPLLDNFGKPLDPNIPGPTLFYNNSQPGARQSAVVRLWKEQVLASFIGLITLILGALVLAACFHSGPLYSTFIPVDNLTGPVVNTSNIGAVVAGIATLISGLGAYVATGVARAWLRRRAVKSEGVTVSQWRTISAGVSIRDAYQTPFLAGGIVLLFTIAMGLNASALAGAAIPAAISQLHSSQHGPAIPFSGNGGQGSLVGCVNPNEPRQCASMLSMSDLANAFTNGVTIGMGLALPGSKYLVAGRLTFANEYYLAAIPPTSANVTLYGGPPSEYAEYSIKTPVSAYTATCSPVPQAGITAGDTYFYESQCLGDTTYFGDVSLSHLTYLSGVACPYANTARNNFRMEIGYAGPFSGSRTGISVYACDITATEGLGAATQVYGQGTLITPTAIDTFESLTQSEMNSTVSAIIAALKAEVGLDGKIGPLGSSLSLALLMPNASDVIGVALSNTLAASASYGYMELLVENPEQFSTTFYSLTTSWSLKGFGWTESPRSLGWSITCLMIALVWFVAAAYMTGGGTRYDPTDWYQTINTSAGSKIPVAWYMYRRRSRSQERQCQSHLVRRSRPESYRILSTADLEFAAAEQVWRRRTLRLRLCRGKLRIVCFP
jgi:hypothetical protein